MLRGPLFAPGDLERKVAKALASAAKAVILDWEDGVAAAVKRAARNPAAALLASGPRRPDGIIWVNPGDTEWYLRHLAAVVPRGTRSHSAAKVHRAGGPSSARLSHLDALEVASGLPLGGIGVPALATEIAATLPSLDYAGVTPRLRVLVYGEEDPAADLGIATALRARCASIPTSWSRRHRPLRRHPNSPVARPPLLTCSPPNQTPEY